MVMNVLRWLWKLLFGCRGGRQPVRYADLHREARLRNWPMDAKDTPFLRHLAAGLAQAGGGGRDPRPGIRAMTRKGTNDPTAWVGRPGEPAKGRNQVEETLERAVRRYEETCRRQEEAHRRATPESP
jgi:hypothetical protein